MIADSLAASHLAPTSPINSPVLWVAGIVCFLLLFAIVLAFCVILQYRLRRLVSRAVSHEAAMSTVGAELEAQALLSRQMSVDLEELRKRVLDHEEIARPSKPIWDTSGVPLNLNRRGQILRLSRKGKSVSEIASDLSIAQGEVELLLKVHDLGQKDPTPEK